MVSHIPAGLLALLPSVASLFAVMLVAATVKWMGLGQDRPRIRDAAHAMQLAEEAECGFAPVSADVDAAGFGALVRNADGATMLIRAHGVHFVARRIDASFLARLDRNRLMLKSAESAFGAVELDFGNRASIIASRLRGQL